MKEIVVLTPEDARCGFALTGVRQLTLVPRDLQATLQELSRDPATGVIVVDERLLADGAQAQLGGIERRWSGLVVVLPSPERAARIEEDYALSLIRRAIGYQVRLSP
ncbi:MAG: V-type ATP synthase subunit F [Steroidobacteraceae bacterium]